MVSIGGTRRRADSLQPQCGTRMVIAAFDGAATDYFSHYFAMDGGVLVVSAVTANQKVNYNFGVLYVF